MLVKAATECASRFMAPIYLVGSSLVSNDPLDVDIIMVLDHRQYWKLFGCTPKDFQELYHNSIYYGPYERMARLVKKQKKFFEAFLGGMDVDFKVQTKEDFESKAKHSKNVRIDQLQNLF